MKTSRLLNDAKGKISFPFLALFSEKCPFSPTQGKTDELQGMPFSFKVGLCNCLNCKKARATEEFVMRHLLKRNFSRMH